VAFVKWVQPPPCSARLTDAGLICMRQPSIPDLAPTSIFQQPHMEDCPRSPPPHQNPYPYIQSPDQQTALFLTWRFEVNEGSANYARPWGTGSSASTSCFSTTPSPPISKTFLVPQKFREYRQVLVRGYSWYRYPFITDQTSIMQSRRRKSWEELTAYFPLLRYVPHRKQKTWRRQAYRQMKSKLNYDRPVRLGVRHPSGTRDQFFFLLEIFFRQLRVCYFVVPSLTRGRVFNLLLLLGRASAVPLWSESRGTQDFYVPNS
jgi:hypothetical protein